MLLASVRNVYLGVGVEYRGKLFPNLELVQFMAIRSGAWSITGLINCVQNDVCRSICKVRRVLISVLALAGVVLQVAVNLNLRAVCPLA